MLSLSSVPGIRWDLVSAESDGGACCLGSRSGRLVGGAGVGGRAEERGVDRRGSGIRIEGAGQRGGSPPLSR